VKVQTTKNWRSYVDSSSSSSMLFTSSPVSTWMGDCLSTRQSSHYIKNQDDKPQKQFTMKNCATN